MLKTFKVTGLNGYFPPIHWDFKSDLNLISGKNGSGKTTLLKLIWFMISGNLEHLPSISFETAEITTDKVFLKVDIDSSKKPSPLWNFHVNSTLEGEYKKTFQQIQLERGGDAINEVNRKVFKHTGGSVFFPTFRRLEGGYTFGDERSAYGQPLDATLGRDLEQFATRFSVGRHQFISSISTDDIVRLLTRQYANISERTNALHKLLSQKITDTIGGYYDSETYSSESDNLKAAKNTLELIKDAVKTTAANQEELLQAFNVLSIIVKDIFQHKGIRITENIIFGDKQGTIASDKLSAGEKQMLSFLCYNAFSNDTCIFIDEPEISLHVDWQRLLFPTLLKQSTSNQFIIATHSPFIYSKYPEKELMLTVDKGDGAATV